MRWILIALLASATIATSAPRGSMSFGEARWRLPEGEFTYGELHVVEVSYNAAGRPGPL